MTIKWLKENMKSKCCQEKLIVVEGDEGTNHYICTSCKKSADMYIDNGQDLIPCHRCGKEYPDFDGFGVLHCKACGYCTHASITGGVCEFCGKTCNPASPNANTNAIGSKLVESQKTEKEEWLKYIFGKYFSKVGMLLCGELISEIRSHCARDIRSIIYAPIRTGDRLPDDPIAEDGARETLVRTVQREKAKELGYEVES